MASVNGLWKEGADGVMSAHDRAGRQVAKFFRANPLQQRACLYAAGFELLCLGDGGPGFVETVEP